MFRLAQFHLDGPICSCEEQELSWSLFEDKTGFGLRISCKTCETQLVIPYTKFKARFVLERPYPGKKQAPAPKPDAKILSLVPAEKEDEE